MINQISPGKRMYWKTYLQKYHFLYGLRETFSNIYNKRRIKKAYISVNIAKKKLKKVALIYTENINYNESLFLLPLRSASSLASLLSRARKSADVSAIREEIPTQGIQENKKRVEKERPMTEPWSKIISDQRLRITPVSHVARLGIKVCRNIKCMKRESQGCPEREALSVSLSLLFLSLSRSLSLFLSLFISVDEHVQVQKRLPPTHLKADGIRSSRTHVRVHLVHIYCTIS